MKPKNLKSKTNHDLILEIASDFAKKLEAITGRRAIGPRRAAVRFMERTLIEEKRPKTRMKFWEAFWRKCLQEAIDDNAKVHINPKP